MERSRNRDDDRTSTRRGRDEEPARSSRRPAEDEPRRGGRDRDEAPASRRRGGDDDRGSRSSGRGSSYSYQSRSGDDAKKRSEGSGTDFDKILKDHIKVYKVKDGDNVLRILPPTWKDAKHFGLDVWVHYGVGPDRATYLDLHKMLGEPDPITEAMDAEKRERDPDEKYVKELTSKRRVLVYVIDRDNPKEGVQAWAMPWTLDRDLVKVSIDKKTGEVLPIDHPEDGYDIEFERKGKGDRTEYLGVQISRRSSELGDDRWLGYAVDNPLPEQLNYYDYDHIAKAFGGQGTQKEKSRGDDRKTRDDDRGGRGREDSSRGRSSEPDELTWESIHDMTAAELDDVIETEKLDIDPNEAKDDADLADWICDELKLKEVPKRSSRDDDEPRRRKVAEDDDAPKARRRVADDADDADDTTDKLRKMRRERGD